MIEAIDMLRYLVRDAAGTQHLTQTPAALLAWAAEEPRVGRLPLLAVASPAPDAASIFGIGVKVIQWHASGAKLLSYLILWC
ncbi:hypothetical protein [Sphingomonas sp.]|uniref:hypothetical protein n=1 Tax=Sphingomonas sp. TaxID=28214 RepID=UPI003D6D9AFC